MNLPSGWFCLNQPSGCCIPQTELRGITPNQLLAVVQEIRRRCEKEKWMGAGRVAPDGSFDRVRLTPETVNLYHLTELLIEPATRGRRCSFVELIAEGPQPPEWFVSHWWGEPVVLFVKCILRHALDHGLSLDTPYWVCAYANNQHLSARR